MNRLKEIRKEKKITLDELSKSLDIPRSTLSRYENGDSQPKQFMWKKIADYFNVSVAYLMGIDNQIVSDEHALEVAKNLYHGYISDNNLKISSDDRKAIEYFNNKDLDNILWQAMSQYFVLPVVQKFEDFQTLENISFLRFWLKDNLIEKYREEVKTNQNLITNVYYKIPSSEEIDDYNKLINKPLPLTHELINSFKEFYPEDTICELNNLNLDKSNLITYFYESSIDQQLKNEIKKILVEARKKIDELKNNYPDKPSRVKQGTTLIYREGDEQLIWSRIGNKDQRDEFQLSDQAKQLLISLGSDYLKIFSEKNNPSTSTLN